MAWISGLAGKAENLLNKIDKNTAAVLSKDKYDVESHDQLTDVTSISTFDSIITNNDLNPSDSPSRLSQFIRPILPADSPAKFVSKPINRDEEFMTFLNTPTVTPKKTINEFPQTLPVTAPSASIESSDSKDSLSEHLNYSERFSPALSHTLVELPNMTNVISSPDSQTENKILRDEVERLQNELLVTVHVDETIESEQEGILNKIEAIKQEYEYKLNHQRLEIEHLMKNAKNSESKNKLMIIQRKLEEQNGILNRQCFDHENEIKVLKEKLHRHEIENVQILKQISDLEVGLERSRMELQSTRQELEQHRARALKKLQEKEKLITELRGTSSNSDTGLESSITTMELDQLRQECSALRQENQQVFEQLRIAREELINADLKIEETCRKFGSAGRDAQEIIALERRKRIDAEEDARIHSEEVRQLKDELASKINNWSIQAKKHEMEVTRLRSQLSAVSTPSSAIESRLATLTQTLVVKQNALENLTTEKNALRLQLERLEHEYRKVLGNSKKSVSINDTDDAKAQVPTFMVESPFDTTVARRVKRAYSSLDAISVRIGVFLRRYPLARIFVIIYIGLLQFWVLIVLLSQSPDAH